MALLVLMSLLAAACGGASESPTADQADSAANGVDTNEADAIATTAPVTFEDEDGQPIPTADPCLFEKCDGEGPNGEAEEVSEWETIVLTVNEDVQVVPVFDAANGNNIVLEDYNAIDNIYTEYPLYGTTVFGNRLSLVVEEYDDSGAWAKVLMPVRPNGTTAWVQTGFFTENRTEYHITVDLSDNEVTLYDGDEVVLSQVSVAGRESRPTPVVRSYIDEKIPGNTQGPAYGDWVLSIAAFSEALGTFGGGGAMPKLALHGTDQPELMGQYVSSGCVRVPNEIVSKIADLVPVGTPVDIIA